MSVQYDFDGRVALVVGAGGPLGSEVVEAFDAAGATVCAVKRDPAGDDVLYDRDAVQFYPADCTVEAEVEAVVDAVLADHGRLDAVYNNLGEYHGGHPLDETPTDEFDFLVEVNLRTAFLVAKHAVPALRETSGAYVNVSAIHSLAGEPNDGPYRATKAGVRLLVESLAAENEDEVRVNAVLPGLIEDPAGVAQLVVYLCSDGASAVTGACVPVDRTV